MWLFMLRLCLFWISLPPWYKYSTLLVITILQIKDVLPLSVIIIASVKGHPSFICRIVITKKVNYLYHEGKEIQNIQISRYHSFVFSSTFTLYFSGIRRCWSYRLYFVVHNRSYILLTLRDFTDDPVMLMNRSVPFLLTGVPGSLGTGNQGSVHIGESSNKGCDGGSTRRKNNEWQGTVLILLTNG